MSTAFTLTVNKRVNKMIKRGLIDDVSSLTDFKELNALNTIGYSEIFKYLSQEYSYEKAIEKHYSVYAKVFNFVRAKIHNDFSFLKALPDFIAIFRYMKKNEDRFGMHIKIADLLKVAKA